MTLLRKVPRLRAPRFVHLSLLASLVLPMTTLAACSGASSTSESAKTASEAKLNPLEGAPTWVVGDCRDHFPGQSVICGVGSVSGVSSPSLTRSTAMARGRTEISRYLSTEVKSIITDYQAAHESKTEQEIEERSTQISEMTLSGSRLAGNFQAKDGTYYGLMVLELEAFKQSVEASSTIDEALKKALIDNATKAFSVRDSEVSRY